MASATVVLAAVPPGGRGAAGWALAAAAAAAAGGVVAVGLAGRLRAAWSLTLGVAVLNVAVFLARGGSLAA